MSPFEQAVARYWLYDLFGKLYLKGISPATYTRLQTVPEFSEVLPDPFDEDEVAAGHYQLFGLNIRPYASLFLEPEGHFGGRITTDVQRFYQSTGFSPSTTSEPADHIGHAMHFMAYLCGAEANAWKDALSNEAQSVRDLQRQFIDQHLLVWVPALTLALQRHNDGLWGHVADLTLELLLNHRTILKLPSDPASSLSFPEVPALLDDKKTSLRDIATYLTHHVYAGLYLSRQDIAQLGRGKQLPRGFGNRDQTLLNLLRSAINFEQLEPLLENLSALIDSHKVFYQHLLEQNTSAIESIATVWLNRLSQTQQIIQAIQQAHDQV